MSCTTAISPTSSATGDGEVSAFCRSSSVWATVERSRAASRFCSASSCSAFASHSRPRGLPSTSVFLSLSGAGATAAGNGPDGRYLGRVGQQRCRAGIRGGRATAAGSTASGTAAVVTAAAAAAAGGDDRGHEECETQGTRTSHRPFREFRWRWHAGKENPGAASATPGSSLTLPRCPRFPRLIFSASSASRSSGARRGEGCAGS